jgi:carbon-monoxide dehydrogenase iron sulfur subunit
MPVTLQCRHCRQAPCLDACLTGALVRDPETQMVVIHENRCIGCWTCTLFCPYGVIYPWPQRGIALKCDRCQYMENPTCVDVCPTRALELVDLDEFETLLHRKRINIIQQGTDIKKDGKVLLLDLAK